MKFQDRYATDPDIEKACGTAELLLQGLKEVIRGKEEFLLRLLACLFAEGHALIEDLPGLGKTTVAKTLAALIGGASEPNDPANDRFFRRIQCTPDLLPYDITGVDIFNPETRQFEFRPGPVFSHVLLADEINRTTPKVQSALLEVMAETQVTVGLRTHRLEPPFFVMATQNPVEIEGTYRLPLAQADRFLMRLSIGYPDPEAEISILQDNPGRKLQGIRPVCGTTEILEAQQTAARIFCDQRLFRAVIRSAGTSRTHRGVLYGVSPRGCLMLVSAARALALLQKRTYVIDQDLVDLAPSVLSHRLQMRDTRIQPEEFVRDIIIGALEKDKRGDGG